MFGTVPRIEAAARTFTRRLSIAQLHFEFIQVMKYINNLLRSSRGIIFCQIIIKYNQINSIS